MNYTIFNSLTGEVEQNLSCSQESLVLQFDPIRQSCRAGTYDFKKTYLVNGELRDKPEIPSQEHVWDASDKCWIDPRTLPSHKDAKWSSVKYQRSRLLADCDWVVTKSAESGGPLAPVWTIYRQALRDITLQADPWAIVWPVAPSN